MCERVRVPWVLVCVRACVHVCIARSPAPIRICSLPPLIFVRVPVCSPPGRGPPAGQLAASPPMTRQRQGNPMPSLQSPQD
eukprot:3039771-Pleurochrysis_carterae.AAC.2